MTLIVPFNEIFYKVKQFWKCHIATESLPFNFKSDFEISVNYLYAFLFLRKI